MPEPKGFSGESCIESMGAVGRSLSEAQALGGGVTEGESGGHTSSERLGSEGKESLVV